MDIQLNDWQDTVASFMRALLPGIVIQTDEEMRAIEKLIKVVRWLGENKCKQREFYVWSEVSLTSYEIFSHVATTSTEVKPKAMDPKDFVDMLHFFAGPKSAESSVLVVCSPRDVLDGSSINRRALRETLDAIQNTRRTIILLGKYSVPQELKSSLTVLDFSLPSAEELEREIVEPVLELWTKNPKIKIEKQWNAAFSRACAGITGDEARRIIALAVAKHAAFDARAVTLALREKERQVNASSVLECITPNTSFKDIGGLEHVKEWIKENSSTLMHPDAAKAYGLELPSGLLCVGPPGTGKSALAKALAGEWQLPCIRFDVGSIYGKYVGESEANLREAIAIATALKNGVIYLDEIEKAFGGDSMDGGVSQRVKGRFLSFMDEKPPTLFVVATANNLQKLNDTPELIRRFAKVFAVDLPDLRARIEIFKIHLGLSGHPMSTEDVLPVAKITRGYSGAEIKTIVQAALRVAFSTRQPHPTLEMLIHAAKNTVPLSLTMSESVTALRQWCQSGRASPAGAVIEDNSEETDRRSLNGLPDLV